VRLPLPLVPECLARSRVAGTLRHPSDVVDIVVMSMAVMVVGR
jgi:hypothetical protein